MIIASLFNTDTTTPPKYILGPDQHISNNVINSLYNERDDILLLDTIHNDISSRISPD